MIMFSSLIIINEKICLSVSLSIYVALYREPESCICPRFHVRLRQGLAATVNVRTQEAIEAFSKHFRLL